MAALKILLRRFIRRVDVREHLGGLVPAGAAPRQQTAQSASRKWAVPARHPGREGDRIDVLDTTEAEKFGPRVAFCRGLAQNYALA
jgi:hypothetical protein